MGNLKELLITSAAVIGLAIPASADEGIRVVEASGNWIAIVHQASSIAAPDVCGASVTPGGLILRIDQDSVEIRVSDDSWSLPAHVAGDVVLTVGTWTKPYPVTGNTADMVIAEVERGDIEELLREMDKAAAMTVTVGKSKPRLVSLIGSTKVTNAFRRCARLNGNAPSGGANPFQ